MLNNNDPNTAPCGTPLLCKMQSEPLNEKTTFWVMSFKYDLINCVDVPSNPKHLNFSISISCELESNNFDRSRDAPQFVFFFPFRFLHFPYIVVWRLLWTLFFPISNLFRWQQDIWDQIVLNLVPYTLLKIFFQCAGYWYWTIISGIFGVFFL